MSSNRTPNITILLKKIIHPVPMYVNRVDIAHREKPAFDKPVGFDVIVGDFVSPYGKGANAQMFFTWHEDHDTNASPNSSQLYNYGYDSRLTITFPNPGDGIQEFDLPGPFDNSFTAKNVGSALRSPQLAPTEGYQSSLVKLLSWHPNGTSTNAYDSLRKNYIFRVNTILNGSGEITGAQYGKIYGDFGEIVTFYLSQETNSRSIECNTKQTPSYAF